MIGPSVTKDGRPIEYPVNELTNILTSATGRGGVSASPPPAVRSGAWGSSPLSAEEVEELNARYAAMGKGTEPTPMKETRPVQPFSLPATKLPLTYQPNFNNISNINLERNVIVVDGLEFPLSKEDVDSLRLMCVNCVLNAVVNGLSGMLASSGIDKRLLVDALRGGVLSEQVVAGVEETHEVQEGQGVQGEGEGTQGSVEQGEQE